MRIKCRSCLREMTELVGEVFVCSSCGHKVEVRVMKMSEESALKDTYRVKTSVQPEVRLLIYCISNETHPEEEEVLREIINLGYEQLTGEEL